LNCGGPVDYADELPAFYREYPHQLERHQHPNAGRRANQRVFDCPAAGGFLLTDDQADLT
jgi:spore maturation protein CgeB